MIKSMTGYGRATGSFDGMDITLELKSVNHRYFEFSSRVPRNFGFLDEKLKSFFQEKISRGKVECYVQIDTAGVFNPWRNLTKVVSNKETICL